MTRSNREQVQVRIRFRRCPSTKQIEHGHALNTPPTNIPYRNPTLRVLPTTLRVYHSFPHSPDLPESRPLAVVRLQSASSTSIPRNHQFFTSPAQGPRSSSTPSPMKPVIVVCCDYYLPGYKAGGPLRTISGLLERLSRDYEFHIVTRDRDLGDNTPYDAIQPNKWLDGPTGRTIYLEPRHLTLRTLRTVFVGTDPDIIYINSIFSTAFSLRPLLLRSANLIPRCPIIIAPRGELGSSALQMHHRRKRLYLTAIKAMSLCKNVIWQASSPNELLTSSAYLAQMHRRFSLQT